MARALAAVLAVGLTMAAGCGRRVNAIELAKDWLMRTCTVGERAGLDDEIRANAAVIELLFIDAFTKGPSDDERREVIQSVEHVWTLMQLQVAEPEVYNLSQAEIDAMKSISLSEEKTWELELFEYNYRAAALAGLGITGGPAGKNLLASTAADSDSPFNSVATEALASNASRQR